MAKMTEANKELRSKANIRYWDKHRKPRLHANGYYTICIGNKKQYYHRYVMEQHLGRKLTKNEHVHHLNGDRKDNRIENLEVVSMEDHLRYHAKERGFGKNRIGYAPPNKTAREKILQIGELYKAGNTTTEICIATGLSRPTVLKYIKEVCNGKMGTN